jgi:hypothetical protein
MLNPGNTKLKTNINMFKEIKYFIQRGKRGYSDRDLWDFDNYLSKIIPPAVRHLAKNAMGCPEILEEIAQGFEAAEQIKTLKYHFAWNKDGSEKYTMEYKEEKQKQIAVKFDRGMELFGKYFLNLWD